MSEKQYRLVTRSDLDGIVSAVLLKKLNMINEIKFVHPKDMQDGTVVITENDITTNLPYNANAHLVFDHHHSEIARLQDSVTPPNYIIDPKAPSAAHVVYHHFGGKNTFTDVPNDMIDGVDKADSAQFSIDDVLNPSSWTLLNFLTDPRTGLGRFHEFTISNYNLMLELVDICYKHTIDQVFENPHVKERIELYNSYATKAKEQLLRCTTVHKNLIICDTRDEIEIFPTNRFMIYALFPDANISIHIMWGLKKQNTVFAVGKSIFNRSSKTNIGDLMLKYNGGGHVAAGTCQLENNSYQKVLDELTKQINLDG